MPVFSSFQRQSPEPKPFNLNNLRVASPCPAEWSKMVGDDSVRHCSECNLNVYNLSAMTEQEVQRLLTANLGQRLCGRFYRRADGTVLTQDCPWSLRVVARKVSRIGTAVLTAMLSTNFAMAKNKPKPAHVEIQEIQQNDSGVQIVAVDAAGAVIPNAHILLENKSNKTRIETATGSNGEASLSKLSPGKYRITVESKTFQPFQRLVHVHKEKLLTIKVPLKLDEATVTVGMVAAPGELLPSPTVSDNPDARHPLLRL